MACRRVVDFVIINLANEIKGFVRKLPSFYMHKFGDTLCQDQSYKHDRTQTNKGTLALSPEFIFIIHVASSSHVSLISY